MSRVVVITPNPAVDVTYRVADQRIGETVRVLTVTRRPGGKGVNVSRVLHQLQVPVTSVLPVGGTSGRWILEQLRHAGDTVEPVEVAQDSRTTVTVVDNHSHPTTLTEPGPAITTAEWRRVDSTLDHELANADILVVAGSLPPGTDPTVISDWIRLATRAGIPSIVDMSGPALVAAADAGAAVVKANATELLEATTQPTETRAATYLRARGCETVVVTRGAEGIAAHTDAGSLQVSAVPGVRGNPVGAGDAATAGLSVGLLARQPLNEILHQAAAAGAAAVLRPIAGEIDPEAYQRFLNIRPGALEQ